MSCKLNTSDILGVTKELTVAHTMQTDEKSKDLPYSTFHNKVTFL